MRLHSITGNMLKPFSFSIFERSFVIVHLHLTKTSVTAIWLYPCLRPQKPLPEVTPRPATVSHYSLPLSWIWGDKKYSRPICFILLTCISMAAICILISSLMFSLTLLHNQLCTLLGRCAFPKCTIKGFAKTYTQIWAGRNYNASGFF